MTISRDKSDDDEENYTDEQNDSENSQDLNEEESVSVNDGNTARETQTQVSAAANQRPQKNDNRFIAKDGTQWSPESLFMNPRGRQPSHNMVRERAGPTRQAAELALTHTGAFSCFITNNILDIIVKCTNEEGTRTLGSDWKETTIDEIQT